MGLTLMISFIVNVQLILVNKIQVYDNSLSDIWSIDLNLIGLLVLCTNTLFSVWI